MSGVTSVATSHNIWRPESSDVFLGDTAKRRGNGRTENRLDREATKVYRDPHVLRGERSNELVIPATGRQGEPLRIFSASHHTFARLAAGAAIGVTSLYSAGLPAPQSVRSSSSGTTTLPPPPPLTEGIALAAPTVGLFIGVSQYGARAGVFPTPAHTLSAALMYEPFFNAAQQSDSTIRKQTLGIPVDNYVKAHTKSVCAAVFTTDGSRFVTASNDGSTTIGRVDGTGAPVALTSSTSDPTRSSCRAAFTQDGAHVAVSRKDAAEVWSADGSGAPVVYGHGGTVGSLSFSRDGSRLLTTSYDGKVRIFSVNGGTPIEHVALEDGCQKMPLAAWSPDESTLVTAGCSAVRVAPSGNPRAARRVGKHDGFVNDLVFSPDGSVFVTAGADGTRIWSVASGTSPLRLPIPKGTRDPGGAVKAAFSNDGSLLAIGYEEGYVEIWPGSGRGVPVALPSFGRGIRTLQFSAEGKHLLVINSTGWAGVVSVTGNPPATRIPAPDAPDTKFDPIRRFEAIDKNQLPPGRSALGITAAKFSPDGHRVLAGYGDGTIGMHPGAWFPDNAGFRVSDLTLLADLEASSDAENSLAVEYVKQLNGALRQTVSFRLPGRPENVTTYRVGAGKPMTRQRILDAIDQTVASARNVWRLQQRVVLVAYVSAHGWTGADGRPYLLPSDADADDPATWIAYEDFIAPITRFLAEPHDKSSFTDPEGADQSRLALVIFDACQTVRYPDLEKDSAAAQNLARSGLIVVQSTSPGRYAWHWTGAMESRREVITQREARWRFRAPEPEHQSIVTSLKARMSALPLAASRLLKIIIEEKASLPESEERLITAGEWVTGTRDAVDILLTEVPDAANPDLGPRARQQVINQAEPRQYDFWIFNVLGTARRPADKAPKP